MQESQSILQTVLGGLAIRWVFDRKWVEWAGSGGAWAISHYLGRALSGRHMWWAQSPVSKRCMCVMLPEGAHTVDGPYSIHPEHFEPAPSGPWDYHEPSTLELLAGPILPIACPACHHKGCHHYACSKGEIKP